MRPRRRYLAVQLLMTGTPPSESELRAAVWQQLQELYGELGVSRIGFWLIEYHPKLRVAIFHCHHDQLRPFRAALVSLTKIGRTQLLCHVRGVSGTIRKARTHLPELEGVKPSILRKRH